MVRVIILYIGDNMKRIIIFICILLFLVVGCFFVKNTFFHDEIVVVVEDEDIYEVIDPEYIKDDISIIDIDGNGINYEFIYNDTVFKVFYTYDNWKIYNSYLISNKNDMKKICQALIDIHPIHGSDMISFRTSDDMVYEWNQHYLAYKLLPSDNSWRNSAKDVDFDPRDQGKSLKEIYEDRTGKKFDF